MNDEPTSIRGTTAFSVPNPSGREHPNVPLAEKLIALAENRDITPVQLASACVAIGLMNDGDLDVAATAITHRIDELTPEAVAGLQGACAGYTGDMATYIVQTDHAEPGKLPEVAVEWQRCPSCDLAIADKTFRYTKDSRKAFPGSTDCGYRYAHCTACGVKVKVIHWSEF